jgi:hypothetical protein
MADTILTDLSEFAGVLAPDDWVYMVDKSDVVTDSNAAGSSFKIQVKNLGGLIPLGPAIVNASAGEFDFDNIPAGFSRLWIKGEVRGDVADQGENVHIHYNSDEVDANYEHSYQSVSGPNTGDSRASTPRIAYVSAGTSPANAYTTLRLCIENYAGGNMKIARCHYDGLEITDSMNSGFSSVAWDLGGNGGTDAITRIRLRSHNNPTDELFGTLRLYGEM